MQCGKLCEPYTVRPIEFQTEGMEPDWMSKLKCYEKNHGREKIINLVKYSSREQWKLARTGTDNVESVKASFWGIRAEHYNQININRI